MKNITAQEKYLKIKEEEIKKYVEGRIKFQDNLIEEYMRKGKRKVGYTIGYPEKRKDAIDKYGDFGEEAWETMREIADSFFEEQGYRFDGSYICW